MFVYYVTQWSIVSRYRIIKSGQRVCFDKQFLDLVGSVALGFFRVFTQVFLILHNRFFTGAGRGSDPADNH